MSEESLFWVEAQISLSKSVVFLASSEDSDSQKNYILASISAYYSLFHFSLAIMWLLPSSLKKSLKEKLILVRKEGNELPDKNISHQEVKKFLLRNDSNFGSQLCSKFVRAKEIREFACYGPRVTFEDTQPIVGPCSFTTNEIKQLIFDIPSIYCQTMKTIKPKTAYEGDFVLYVLNESQKIISNPELPFKDWFPDSILERAGYLIIDLIDKCKSSN
jgi:hypothetical protein